MKRRPEKQPNREGDMDMLVDREGQLSAALTHEVDNIYKFVSTSAQILIAYNAFMISLNGAAGWALLGSQTPNALKIAVAIALTIGCGTTFTGLQAARQYFRESHEHIGNLYRKNEFGPKQSVIPFRFWSLSLNLLCCGWAIIGLLWCCFIYICIK